MIYLWIIFKELFDGHKELIEFEKNLDNLNQDIIKAYNEKINKNRNDINSFINLLKEIYDKNKYEIKEKYPNYEYFYYSNYLDEDYILKNILCHNDINKYPMLNKYLNYKKNKVNENDKYPLVKFNLFNKVLNMISEKYSHKISRQYAENTFLKDTEIYKNAEN